MNTGKSFNILDLFLEGLWVIPDLVGTDNMFITVPILMHMFIYVSGNILFLTILLGEWLWQKELDFISLRFSKV